MADSGGSGDLSGNSPVAVSAPAASTTNNTNSGIGFAEKKTKKIMNAKPKVKKSLTVGGKNLKVTSRPKTQEMVDASIKELKERNGSSLPAIKKYISTNYKVDAQKIAPFIRKYLKSAVASGKLVQTKGKGASGSFKLSIAAKNESAALAKKKMNKTSKKIVGGTTKVKKSTKTPSNVSESPKKLLAGSKAKKSSAAIEKVKKVNAKVISEKKTKEKLKVKNIKKSGVVKSKTVKAKSASSAVKPKVPKAKTTATKKPSASGSTKKIVASGKKAGAAKK